MRGRFFGNRHMGETATGTKLDLRNTQVSSWGYFQVLLYGDVRMRFRPNSSWGRSRIALPAHRTADHLSRKPNRLGHKTAPSNLGGRLCGGCSVYGSIPLGGGDGPKKAYQLQAR